MRLQEKQDKTQLLVSTNFSQGCHKSFQKKLNQKLVSEPAQEEYFITKIKKNSDNITKNMYGQKHERYVLNVSIPKTCVQTCLFKIIKFINTSTVN